ncbi:MAG TPA: hypothetical protein VGC30_15020 [Dokdonella sp.]
MFFGRSHRARLRHPLVRLLSGLVGVAALLMLLALGALTVLVIALGGGAFLLARALRRTRRSAAAAGGLARARSAIIDGEFTVVAGARHGEPAR